MNELLEKINSTIDDSINTSTPEVGLQLKILKGNINTIFNEYMTSNTTVTTGSAETNEPVSSKKNILIVDDSSIIRNYLQKAVADKYDVTPVSGGADAIEVIPTKKIDLILLDLMMPGIDGFGVLDYLKQNNVTTPVVIISGDTTKETIDRAFTYSVVDMIEKPFSEKVIMDKINRILD